MLQIGDLARDINFDDRPIIVVREFASGYLTGGLWVEVIDNRRRVRPQKGYAYVAGNLNLRPLTPLECLIYANEVGR